METECECVCGRKMRRSPDVSGTWECPDCGKKVTTSSRGAMGLSESAIDATYEVMAEEGAIWSGAR